MSAGPLLLLGLRAAWAQAEAEPPAAPPPAGAVVDPAPAPDRSRLPVVPPPRLRPPLEPVVLTLQNGVQAWILPTPGLGRARVSVRFADGITGLCPRAPARCAALGDQLGAGAGALDAEGVAQALDGIDAELRTAMGRDAGWVELDAPLLHLDDGLDRLRDVLIDPSLARRELRRWRRETRQALTSHWPSDPWATLSEAERQLWLPPDHPWGARTSPAAVRRVRAGDLRAAQAARAAESPLTVFVVGDVNPDDLRPHLALLINELGPGAAGPPAPPPPPAHAGVRWIGVDMPGRAQAALSLSLPAPDSASPEAAAALLLSRVVMDGFQSRINLKLREERGWTYGVAGSWEASPGAARFQVQVEVPVDKVLPAAADIEAELARAAAAPPTAAELAREQAGIAREHNRALIDEDTASAALIAAWRWGGAAALRARADAVMAVQPADVQALASRALGPEAARRWVLVGDRAALDPALRAAGHDVLWISPQDAVLGRFPTD